MKNNFTMHNRKKIKIYLYGLVFAVFVCGGLWLYFDLVGERNRIIDDRSQIALEQSKFMSQWLTTLFLSSDYVLRDVREKVNLHDLDDATKIKQINSWLGKKAATVPGLSAIGIYDSNLIYRADNLPEIIGFRTNQTLPTSQSDDKVRFQYMPTEKSANKRPTILLNRIIFSQDEKIMGGVVAAVDLNFAQNWIQSFKVGSNDVMALMDAEGTLLARNPEIPEDIGKRINLFQNQFESYKISGRTSFIASSYDGVQRIYGITKMEELPIVLVVGYDLNNVLAEWQHRAWQISCGFILLTGLAIFAIRAYIKSLISIQLKEQNSLKDIFLANTSHEFRTPLHGIIHMAQAVLEDPATNITSQQQKNLSMVVSSAQRLSILVTDILDFEKIKNNDINLYLKPIDTQAAIDTVLEVFRHLVKDGQVNLVNRVRHGLPPVKADENRLRQVLYNLIGNALKFTVSGEISVDAAIQEDKLYISVTDTGIGIPQEKYEDIFLSFEQVSAGRAEQYGGSGLGLAITRQLVERMNGRIWVACSEMGKGTEIVFTLPLCQSDSSDNSGMYSQTDHVMMTDPQPDIQPIIRKGGEFTILAVDDDPINLQIMVHIFAKNNYNILTATSGAEAIEIVNAHENIDILLLDVMMPSMSGFEVCRRLRETYSLFELPVLLITARSLPADVATGFAAGANDYVVKPFQTEELRARVTTLLSLKKAAHDIIRTEVAFLQSQIKPHFFYNVLNTIISLCYTDSSKAGKLLVEFSNYLRRSFNIQEHMLFTTLENELELVKSYVVIEQARFGERLVVVYDISPDVLCCQIPPLAIQPLVENAVRHGLMSREEGGKVVVSARREAEQLIVQVSDDGIGIKETKLVGLLTGQQETSSVGLRNINRRLLKFYGETLQITSQEGQGTVVTLRFPASCPEFVQRNLS